MSPSPDYFAQESTYRVEFRTSDEPARPSRRNAFKTRRAARPESFNGIHRRRAKRIAW